MLCSEWVPSEWESDKNITIIHTTPVHQLTSGEDKSWNKSSIKMLLTKTRVHNPVEKVFWSESGEKSAPFTSQNSSKQICGWILMWDTTGDALFHWRTCYYGLWTQCILVKNVLMMDLFQRLSSPDVNWWTGVVWITCDVFIRLSFWRHPFTAEHPLLRHWCRDAFLQTWWRNTLILILDRPESEDIFIFGWTIPLSRQAWAPHNSN